MTPAVNDGHGEDFTGRRPSAPGHSQSLAHGLAILACFTSHHRVRGVAEIADAVQLLPQTTHRHLSTLVALGYLQREPDRRYRLTLGVTRLGLATLAATGLREHARRYIEELCRCSFFTISLAVLDGPEILHLDRVASARHRGARGEERLRAGSRLPAHCTAMGKLLLAHCPPSERSRHLREIGLTTETPATITGKQALRRALARIRTEGFAVNDEEFASGAHAVAVPIHDAGGEVIAALGMTAPSTAISLASLVEQLKPHLLLTAGRISGRLGYRGR